MPITWPQNLLKPQILSVDLAPRSLKSAPAINGRSQVIAANSGIWKASFQNVPVYGPSMITAWRSIQAYADGRTNQIILPAYDWLRSPIHEYYTYDFLVSDWLDSRHDDDTLHDDDTPYDGAYTTIKTTAVSLVGGVQFSVEKLCSSWLEPGKRFSIDHRLYEIREMISQDDTNASFYVRPNIRESISIGRELQFDYPTLLVNLADDDQMNLPLNNNRRAETTVNFIEAF